MTITDVRTRRVTSALHTPFVTALRRTSVVETTVVEIVDSDGVRGFGEAPQVWRVTGESLAGAEACLNGPLRDLLLDRDSGDLEDLGRAVADAIVGNAGAKSAADVALHDLAARRRRLSLPRFLGTTHHQAATDVTVSAGPPDQQAADAAARVSDGFTVLKLKVGTDAVSDVASVRAVRAAVGPDVTIRVDANQGWTPKAAIRAIHALEDAGVGLELVEQPVAADDLAGLALVTARVDTPVMADESVFGLRDLVRVIESGAADLVNIKLAKCGGLTTALAMARLARAHGIGFLVGSMMEGPIGVGAAAALAAAVDPPLTSDLDAAWWLASSPVLGGLGYEGGIVVLPTESGLGIEGVVA
jgi:L-alanine-DL-glutamate epimerase-like enolase superfamily enzyme